jgi:hypothetical protein
MIALRTLFHREGEPPLWPEIKERHVYHLAEGSPPITVACLEDGMSSGQPSVMLRVDLPNGAVVIAETSARLFCTAARMIMARHPDLFDGD